MRKYQVNSFWVALLSLAGSALSEKAECGDGVEFNTRQGDQSTFSIPLNETCSAALITFSDGTDSMLDLQTNSSCPYVNSEAQTFTTVFGADTSEGVATLTFQCSGQVYCMSINVVKSNDTDSQTWIQSICADPTGSARESLNAAGTIQTSGVSDGPMHEGSIVTSTSTLSSPSSALQDISSMTTASLSGSTGFSTIRGASGSRNGTNATSLDTPGGGQSSSQSRSAVSVEINFTTTTTGVAVLSNTPYSSTSQAATASPEGTNDVVPALTTGLLSGVHTMLPTGTNQSNGNPETSIKTPNQTSEDSQPVESEYAEKPTMLPVTGQALANGTTMELPTQAAGQDPSTCACFPLPTF
ncbi:hypothetical protein KCV03_g9333, partial [Aureobasidium melanogenum]